MAAKYKKGEMVIFSGNGREATVDGYDGEQVYIKFKIGKLEMGRRVDENELLKSKSTPPKSEEPEKKTFTPKKKKGGMKK